MATKKIFLPALGTCLPPGVLHLMLYFLARQYAANTSRPGSRKKTRRIPGKNLKNQTTPIRLEGNALCLLKTQFAKKPKNPV